MTAFLFNAVAVWWETITSGSCPTTPIIKDPDHVLFNLSTRIYYRCILDHTFSYGNLHLLHLKKLIYFQRLVTAYHTTVVTSCSCSSSISIAKTNILSTVFPKLIPCYQKVHNTLTNTAMISTYWTGFAGVVDTSFLDSFLCTNREITFPLAINGNVAVTMFSVYTSSSPR